MYVKQILKLHLILLTLSLAADAGHLMSNQQRLDQISLLKCLYYPLQYSVFTFGRLKHTEIPNIW